MSLRILMYIVTILLAIGSFLFLKQKTYKNDPAGVLMCFICFIGCSIYSISSIGWLPKYFGEFSGLGIMMSSASTIRIYALLHCKKKIEAVYSGEHVERYRRGFDYYYPIFQYTYNENSYYQQTVEHYFERKLKKMTIGDTYKIYVDPKHPQMCMFKRKLNIIAVGSIMFGAMCVFFGLLEEFANSF